MSSDEPTPAQRREQDVAQMVDVELTALPALIELALASYTVEGWGLTQFSTIGDVEQRALASDLLLSALEGVRGHLIDLGLRERQFRRLLGPNGRTMPGADTPTEQLLELVELDACATDCMRAVGSTLDCLAAAAILLMGAPLSVSRAHGSALLRQGPKKVAADPWPEEWNQLVTTVRQLGNEPVAGWLAWSLETRNAVVHRGRLLRTWVNRPRRGPRVPVVTRRPIEQVVRMEPHLRRRPWQPDMAALRTEPGPQDLWITEPSDRTLHHLKRALVRLVETVACELTCRLQPGVTLGDASEHWQLLDNGPAWRLAEADEFCGFEPGYPQPSIDQAHFHPHTAKRAYLASQLRERQSSNSKPRRSDEQGRLDQ